MKIPKFFRRNAARYGVTVEEIISTHRKNPASTLNHGRDRAERRLAEATNQLLDNAALAVNPVRGVPSAAE